MAFTNNFNELLKQSPLSDQQLAKEIGIHIDTLKRLRNGYNTPRIETLQKIATFFGKSTDELLQ
jgi:transcriptional regulator with XRE-family HTH domain